MCKLKGYKEFLENSYDHLILISRDLEEGSIKNDTEIMKKQLETMIIEATCLVMEKLHLLNIYDAIEIEKKHA